MCSLSMTRHADRRARQRGVNDDLIDFVLAHADVDAPIGSNCRIMRISRGRLRDRTVRKAVGGLADRLSSLALIWSDDAGAVITVLHHADGPRGRRYRTMH